MKKLILFVGAILLSQNGWAAKGFGKLTVSGDGCEKQDVPDFEPRPGSEDRFQIPVFLVMDKAVSDGVIRKICQFALPIKLKKKERLQVLDLSQNVTIKASDKAHAKFSLSIFGGDQSIKNLEIELKKPKTLDEELKKEGMIFQTACGKDVLLRGSASVFAEGAGIASANTGYLELTLKKVACK
jgi:hypothetical protein